jgi:hypothetical protein
MFERFTERARRVLFFARYTATQTGARSIETDHLIAGIMRDREGRDLLGPGMASLCERLMTPASSGQPTSTQIEIPFTDGVKRVLMRAAALADSRLDDHIGGEHLLAAAMEDETSASARALKEAGVNPERFVGRAGAAESDVVRVPVPERPAAAGSFTVLEEAAIRRVVDRLFVETDAKHWDSVRGLFADGDIAVDMTSLAGGVPSTMSADDLVGAFGTALHLDKASHHLVTNVLVTSHGPRASVTAQGYAWNRVASFGAGNDLWETWGTYAIALERGSHGWRITGFTYTSKLTRGNVDVWRHLPE